MIRRPTRSTRTDTLFPYTTLFRSLVGIGGDNRSFVQLLAAPDRLIGFSEVAWPDRDFFGLSDEPLLQIGGEPLWGFVFPDEQPLVAFWSEFRETKIGRAHV